MNIDTLKMLGWAALLVVVQALVLNHIHLFNVATPLLYVYFVMMFRRNYPKSGILVWCFTMGLMIDVFANTPGVAAGSLTLLGLVQPYLLELFVPRDSADDLMPGFRTLTVGKYILYALLLSLLYCLSFFTLEHFNFFNWLQWAECVGGSMLLTLLLVLVLENFRSSNR